jgi:hypothetical protein
VVKSIEWFFLSKLTQLYIYFILKPYSSTVVDLRFIPVFVSELFFCLSADSVSSTAENPEVKQVKVVLHVKLIALV